MRAARAWRTAYGRLGRRGKQLNTKVCFDDAEAVNPEDIEDLPDVDDNGNVVLDGDGNAIPGRNMNPNSLTVISSNITSTISRN